MPVLQKFAEKFLLCLDRSANFPDLVVGESTGDRRRRGIIRVHSRRAQICLEKAVFFSGSGYGCSEFAGGTNAFSIAGVAATAAELELALAVSLAGLLHAGDVKEEVGESFGVVAGDAAPSGENDVHRWRRNCAENAALVFAAAAVAVSFLDDHAGLAAGVARSARALR